MIRLIQRRLIIPQGDTGTFTIPTQGSVSEGDQAIFAIYDNLTHTTVLEKQIAATNDTLTFSFEAADTIDIEPDDRGSRYSWDITLMRDPIYENEELVGYGDIDSYYSAFRLPPCVIKRVTRDVHK